MEWSRALFFCKNNIQCVLCLKLLSFGAVVLTVNILEFLIGLVLIFKNEISSIVSSAFDSIKLNSEAIVK